jgi:membrane associated rhomboid family serine protease
MGMSDRDYYRRTSSGGSGPMSQLTPVVKFVLIFNIAIFIIDMKMGMSDGPIQAFGAFAIQSAIFEGKIWEFLTFQFIHGSFGHVLFNSIGLFFFGPWLERWWGSKKFLIYYLLCGAAGAVFFTLLVFLGILPNAGIQSGLIGASAGIYGIFVGVAMIAPNMRVSLVIPPIELSMRQLAIALLVIAVGTILLPFGKNQGGEAGHLGGAILGYVLMRFPGLLARAPRVKTIRPAVVFPPPEPKIRPRTAVEKDLATELDRILDKISSHGFQSLTDSERETLQKASNPRP